MRIVRIVGDHFSIKVRFSFIHESIAQMAVCSISAYFDINDIIQGAGGLAFIHFDLTGACLSSKDLNVMWYCSHNCDKTALGLVISLDFTLIIKCKNVNVVSVFIMNITLRVNWIMLTFYFCYDREMTR